MLIKCFAFPPTVTWVGFLPHGIAMSSKRAHGKPEDWPGTCWCSPATCHLPPAVLCVWSREFSHLQNGDMLNTAEVENTSSGARKLESEAWFYLLPVT